MLVGGKMNQETIEIIKEARKAGMQVAFLLTGLIVLILLVFGGLFGYYIYKSYDTSPTGYIEAEQTNSNGNNTISQGVK